MDRTPFEQPLEPFESPKDLLDGTEEDITKLEAMCEPFTQTRDYEVITHTDPNTRDKVVKIRLKHRLPPAIRREASNIMKQIRLALDQAFCDGAVVLGRANAKNIYFPFGKDAEDLKKVVERHCIKVDERLVAFCVAFEPYYGGKNTALWSMSSLAGTTHQKSIGLGFQDNGSFVQTVAQHAAIGPFQLIMNKWNDLHNELEVARLAPGGQLGFDPDFTLSLNIVFSGRSHSLSYRPVIDTLYELLDIAKGIVMGIEAETARLKGLP